MTDSPRQQLANGVAVLAPALEPHGFIFSWGNSGNSSGGPFALGRFNRQSRQLSLHHRFGLGIVTFGVDDLIVPHEHYVTFLGVEDRSKLLWSPLSSGLDRYHALRFDIEHLCADFTTGDAKSLELAARDYATRMHEQGLQFNAEAAGDVDKRRLAREAFGNARYADVINLLNSLECPDLLTRSEIRMAEIARSRTTST